MRDRIGDAISIVFSAILGTPYFGPFIPHHQMASGLIVGGFDFDTCDVELATVQQAHVGAATLGAAAMETVVIEDLAAVQALALWMEMCIRDSRTGPSF